MVSVLARRIVDRRFEPWSDQTKDYKIGICCFSAKHAALRRKIKDWLSLNQYKVSEWNEMSIRGLLFQLTQKVDRIPRFKTVTGWNWKHLRTATLERCCT
jgi:hypothetical protein